MPPNCPGVVGGGRGWGGGLGQAGAVAGLEQIVMLDFATQKKLLQPLLKSPTNHVCADCDAISPTWVSLDFGVFLCSNCSGAHRALGPTITRVRSANLDAWQREWLDNMQIGNQAINLYWESDPRSQERKPKLGATLDYIGRYVYEKYIKKKFVTDLACPHPLQAYKNGAYTPAPTPSTVPNLPKQQAQSLPQTAVRPKVETPAPQQPKQQISLLLFDEEPQPTPVQTINAPQPHHEDDEFTEFTEVGTSFTTETSKDSFLSFDALMNQQRQPNPNLQHAMSSQNMFRVQPNVHHPYNPMLGQHNLVYNAQFHPVPHPHYPPHGFSPQLNSYAQGYPPQQYWR